MSAESRGRVKVEPSAKRVRAFLGGQAVVDSAHPVLVWEVPYFPAYYFPEADVRMDWLVPSDRVEHSPSRGEARYFDVMVGDRVADSAAWS
jgi:uncharacterized protein (DUF427 family)